MINPTELTRIKSLLSSTFSVTEVTSNGADPSVITITTATAHNLSPSANVQLTVENGTNVELASGSFTITSIPSSTTFTYTAKPDGVVVTNATVSAPGITTPNNQTIPVTSITSNGQDPSEITITTAIPHNLSPGANVQLTVKDGTNTLLASGQFPVTILNPNTFKYTASPGDVVVINATCTLYAISDPGVDDLGGLLNKQPIPELLSVMTDIETNNLAFNTSTTQLPNIIKSSVLSGLLADDPFQSLVDAAKLPEVLKLLTPNEFVSVAGSTALGSRISGSNLFSLLTDSGALESMSSIFQGNFDLKNLSKDVNLLNTYLAATANGQLLFDNFTKPIQDIYEQISKSLTDESNLLFSDVISQITSLTKPFQDLIPADLKGVIDLGFGFKNAVGGPAGGGSFLQYSANSLDGAPQSSGNDTTKYDSLERILTRALSQDWRAKNAEPGNPLILEAYAYSGKNYKKDGKSGEYVWNAAFVNWVLAKAGFDFIKTMSPMAYAGYGTPVDFGTFKKVRKNDIIVMNSAHGLGHIGFIRAYDPKTNLVTVLGGNQAGTVKLTKINVSRSDPTLYVSHIRRNWAIPAADDVPLFQFKSSPYAMIASRPEIPARSAASRRDANVGGSGAASGGTLT